MPTSALGARHGSESGSGRARNRRPDQNTRVQPFDTMSTAPSSVDRYNRVGIACAAEPWTVVKRASSVQRSATPSSGWHDVCAVDEAGENQPIVGIVDRNPSAAERRARRSARSFRLAQEIALLGLPGSRIDDESAVISSASPAGHCLLSRIVAIQ